jgi:uncharacterized protein HemX
MQFMSNSSDETKPAEARTVRSWRRRVIPIVVLLLAAAGVGGVVIWQKHGEFVAPSQTAETETQSTPATPVAAETSQGLDTTAQLLKDLQTAQQQAADKLEDLQRQLAAEQDERKLLSDQVAALAGRVNSLSASNASVTSGTALQAAKKKSKLPDTAAPRPVGGSRQAGPAPSQ